MTAKIYMHPTPLMEDMFRKTGRRIPSSGIEIDDIYTAVAAYNESHEPVDISAVLEGSTVVKKESSPTTVANLSEMELMRLRAEERRYQRSISSIPVLRVKGKSEFKSMSESIAFASQLVLAFGSAFLCGYYLGEYFFNFEKAEYKYMLGGACSFLTLILESLLFIIRDSKQQMVKKSQSSTVTCTAVQPVPQEPCAEPLPAETELKAQAPESSIRKRLK